MLLARGSSRFSRPLVALVALATASCGEAQSVDDASVGDASLGNDGQSFDEAWGDATANDARMRDARRDTAPDRDAPESDASRDVAVRDSGLPPRPDLNAFWNNATRISPGVWYIARAYVRPSTHSASPIHALAVYFEPGPPGSATHDLVVSGDRPCGSGYCTTPQWAMSLRATPVFAVNGDYFSGVNYSTGVGNADTIHLWRTMAGGVLDPGSGMGAALSTTGHSVAPSITSVMNLPTGTQNVLGADGITESFMGDPANPDYFAARTATGVDGQGYLFVLVAEGFDHAGSVNGNGLTRHDAWQAATDMGATRVLLHDGGGSSQLFIRGRGLVYPASNPRYVANHVGVQD